MGDEFLSHSGGKLSVINMSIFDKVNMWKTHVWKSIKMWKTCLSEKLIVKSE